MMARLRNWFKPSKKKKSTSLPKFNTFKTFVPSPGFGMFGFDDLSEFLGAVGDVDILLISEDRRTIITFSDQFYYIYEGDELKEGVNGLNKKRRRTK